MSESFFGAFLTPLTSRYKAVDTSLSPSSKEYKALPFEQQVFRAINLVRKNPSVFVKLLDTYKNILEVKHKEDDETNNNNNASSDSADEIKEVEEAMEFLKKQESLPPLRLSEALSKAAKEGIRSKSLEDTALMQTRIEKFGEWDDVLAENVHYGDQSNITGTNIVLDWIVDAGVRNRGHRANIFSSDFHVIGVAVGTHNVHKNVCVATFTGDFKEKEVKGVRFVDEVETSNGTVETYNDVPLKEVVADSEGQIISEEKVEQVKKVENSPARRTFYETSVVTPARISFMSDDLLSKYEEMGIPIAADLKRKRIDVVGADTKRNKTNGTTTPTNRRSSWRKYSSSAPVTPVQEDEEEGKGIFRRFLDVISPFR